MAVDLRQTHFRFGKDDGTEASHTFWQNEDTDHTQLVTGDWTFLLRFTEQEMGGTAASNTAVQFQYNHNGAGWVDITITSSVVKAVAVGAFSNNDDCTKRLSGTGAFETSARGCTTDGSSGGNFNDIAASGNSETEAGLAVVFADVANNDTIQFRFTSPDWTVTWDIIPTLTINKGTTELGAFTLSGSGIVGVLGGRTRNGVGAFVGSGSLQAIGARTIKGQFTASGLGGLGVSGGRLFSGTALISGAGSLSALGGKILVSNVSLSGLGSLSTLAQRIQTGSLSLTGLGELSVIGQEITGEELGQVTFSGAGSLSTFGRGRYSGRSVLSASGLLSVLGGLRKPARFSLSGSASLVVLGGKAKFGKAIFNSFGFLVAKAAFPDVMLLTGKESKVFNLNGSELDALLLISSSNVYLLLEATLVEKGHGSV